jgi:uncharacterized protein (TIGR01319 family)
LRRIDLLAAEIGSTTTVVSAFDGLTTDDPVFLGQGVGPTTVVEGDVRIGLNAAMTDLSARIGPFEPDRIAATSSAAGGLVMTVHGLVYDMTVKAAKEAALGAGGVIRLVTAGRIRPETVDDILKINPRIIILAGGVDYGEEEVILENARLLAALPAPVPIVYAGNSAIQKQVAAILQDGGKEVLILPNVYPRIDELNIEPARKLIVKLFEEKITQAPGMSHIREMVNGHLKPTPGAVMDAAVLLQKTLGDLVVIDVGGATTDVHSVAEGSSEIRDKMISPEPFAKRTVEGDLGVYINAHNVAETIGFDSLRAATDLDPEVELERLQPIPTDEAMRRFVEALTLGAAKEAVNRHVGRLRYLYTPSGRVTVASGKDLTTVKWIVGTGGALTRLNIGTRLENAIRRRPETGELLPEHPQFLTDSDYILAAIGLIAEDFPDAATALMLKSFGMRRDISGS